MSNSINLKEFIERISYNKSQTYTKEEVLQELAKIQLLSIVDTLPTENIPSNKIFLVLNNEEIEGNKYDLFVYVNNKWEQIDSLEFNIEDYPTKNELEYELSLKADINHGHDNVTTSLDGFMSKEDKSKLNGIENQATRNLPSDDNPLMDGTASSGTGKDYSRKDHVHPTDTSRASSTHVHGNITNDGKIGSTANKPLITTTSGSVTTGNFETSTNNIKMDGTVNVGSSNNFARSDHVHPTDTSRASTDTATSSKNGLMSKEDKSKLDGVEDEANNYIHPSYTAKTNGLYKVTVDNTGHISGTNTVSGSDLPSHNHDTGDMKDTSAYGNIGSSANATQKTINNNINTKLGQKANSSDVYTKSQTMTSTEIGQAIADGVSNVEIFEVVTTLPTSNIKGNKFYLVPNGENIDGNVYDVNIYVNNKWETIDKLEFDISNYPTTTQVNSLLEGKVDKTDSRLTDSRTPKSHTHGNITNTGAIGSTSGKIVTTGTNGVLTTSDTITKSQISDFPSTMTPSSHTHGAVQNKGTLNSDTTSTNKVVVTDSSNNIKTISKLPLDKVTHQDISGKASNTHTHGSIANNGTLNSDTTTVGKVVVTDGSNNIKTISKLPSANVTHQDISGKAPNNHKSTATTYGVGDASNYGHVKVDSSMNATSTNPVQNKVVKDYIDEQVGDIVSGDVDLSNTHNHDDRYVGKTDSRLTDARTPKFNNIPSTSTSPADLNTYRTGGFYYCCCDANNAKYALNCPKSGNDNKSFFLLVETWGQGDNNSYVKQTLTYYDTNETYIRICSGNNWNKWKLVGDTTEYIVGTQTASTSAWTGKSNKIHSLSDGQIIYYKLPYASTSTAVTLNLTLADGTTTGAKEVWFWNGQRLTTHYGVNSVVGLIYNGSQWWVINPSSNGNNNNYYLLQGVTITNGDTTDFTGGNIVGAKKDGKYYKLVNGLVLDVSYPLVEANGTINANTTSNNIQLVNPFLSIANIGMTTGTITVNYPLYLEGTYNRGQFTLEKIICDNSTHSTLTNGKYYIRIGTVYDSTHFRFVSDMSVYRWDSTAGNMVPVGSSYTDLANKPSTFTPSAHNQASSTITEASALGNLGTSANATQATINSKINEKIGTLSSIKAIEVVASKPTASASTMNKLYIVSENSKVNVYYTKQSGSTYTLEKMDEDILDELSIAWNDITGKPSSFTPASHSHGSLANGGTLNSDITSVNKVAVTDSSNNLKTISQLPYSKISGTPTIPTKTSQLTNDSNFTTATGHTHKNLVKTEITSGSLDTVTTTGWYSYNTTNSNSITNVPEKVGSVMEVLDDYGNGSYVIQKVYPIRTDKNQIIYYRVKFDTSGWSSWRRIDGGDKANSTHNHPDTQLNWNGSAIAGGVSPVDMAMYEEFSANRLAFLPGNNITIEYSTNGGSTWADYGATATQKMKLITTEEIFTGGKGSTTDYSKNRLRITINAGDITSTVGAKVYLTTRKLMIYFCECNASNTKVLIEKAPYTADTTFSTVGTYDVKGWTGWNSIPLNITFGGYANQGNANQVKKLRLTFTCTGGTGNFRVNKLRLFGETQWAVQSNLARNGHLYSYDENQIATFPSNIVASKFIKNGVNNTNLLTANGGDVAQSTFATSGHTHSNYLTSHNPVDTALSSTSTNAVQNKVINTALGNKVDKVSGKGLSTNDFTATYKTALDNLNTTIANAVSNLEMIEVVTSLPTSNIKTNKLYLKANSVNGSENKYDFYVRVNNAWEKIDSLDFSISDYIKKDSNTNLLLSNGTTKAQSSFATSGHTHGSIANNGTLNSDVTSTNMNKLVVTDGSNNIKTAICTYTNGKLNFGSG